MFELITRREFLKQLSVASTVALAPQSLLAALAAPPLRIGIIGLGSVGQHCLSELCALEGVKVAAVCDYDANVLRDVAFRFGVGETGMYTDSTHLFQQNGIDGIVFAVPQKSQNEILSHGFALKKSIYIEHAMTTPVWHRVFSGHTRLVCGRPTVLGEDQRASILAIGNASQGGLMADVRCVATAPSARIGSIKQSDLCAEALVGLLPFLESDVYSVSIDTAKVLQPVRHTLTVVSICAPKELAKQPRVRIEIEARESSDDCICVSLSGSYGTSANHLRFETDRIDPRRRGLGLFIAQMLLPTFRPRLDYLREQQAALATAEAIFAGMPRKRGNMQFNFAQANGFLESP